MNAFPCIHTENENTLVFTDSNCAAYVICSSFSICVCIYLFNYICNYIDDSYIWLASNEYLNGVML